MALKKKNIDLGVADEHKLGGLGFKRTVGVFTIVVWFTWFVWSGSKKKKKI